MCETEQIVAVLAAMLFQRSDRLQGISIGHEITSGREG
jgi:hypothetical protein